MLSEYIRHRVIGSPLEPLANQLRGHRIRRHCRRSPEIAEALAESLYFDEIFAEQITDGMNCIDAGAHIGSVLSAFRRLSPRGHHIAIEPTPYKARWLRRRFGKTRIEEVALASEPRTATFYHFPRNSAFSGLRVQRSGAKARGGGGDATPGQQEFQVQCVRLDDIVGDRRFGFMKMDVEGAELDALKGASRLLERDRPAILLECTQIGLEAFGNTADDIFALLGDHGYDIFIPRPRRLRGKPLDRQSFQGATVYPFRAWNFLVLPRPSRAPRPPRRPADQAVRRRLGTTAFTVSPARDAALAGTASSATP